MGVTGGIMDARLELYDVSYMTRRVTEARDP